MSKPMIKKDTQDNQDIEAVETPKPSTFGNVSGERYLIMDIGCIECGAVENSKVLGFTNDYNKALELAEEEGSYFSGEQHEGMVFDLTTGVVALGEALSNEDAPDRKESPDAK